MSQQVTKQTHREERQEFAKMQSSFVSNFWAADGVAGTGEIAEDLIAVSGKRPNEAGLLLSKTVPPVSFPQRAVEVSVAAAALLLAMPIMLLFRFLIRRGTPGPALFFQDRMGLSGIPFRFVKFRTLYADARERFPELYAYQYTKEELDTLKFKLVNDPRVTPQGRWMRKTTLDELPNFWNVLVGDMALVGPRPEIPEMLPYYKGEMLKKFTVRPGLTGYAQIRGRGRLGFYETVDMDVQYAKERSFWLDLKIILLTLVKMVTREGAF